MSHQPDQSVVPQSDGSSVRLIADTSAAVDRMVATEYWRWNIDLHIRGAVLECLREQRPVTLIDRRGHVSYQLLVRA